MPQKTPIPASSIHRNQLYHRDGGQASTTVEVRNAGTTPVASAPAGTTTLATPNALKQHQVLRKNISEHANNVRWELTSPFTINAGPSTTIVPFDNENIGGQGAFVSSAGWFFQPPPKYAGVYHVGAYIEFLSGLLQAIKASRLEIWITNAITRQERRWSVLDKQYMEYGNVDDDGYLEKIVLGNSDLVRLRCDEIMSIRVYTDNNYQLVLGDMNSLYGYVFVHWCGCMGEPTDTDTATYNLPDFI